MGITVEWDNAERTMIRLDIAGMWTWDDFNQAIAQAFAMIDSVEWKVAVLTVSHEPRYRPANVLPYFWQFFRSRYRWRSYVILVEPIPFGKSVLYVLLRLNPSLTKRIGVAPGIAEARQMAAARLAAHQED